MIVERFASTGWLLWPDNEHDSAGGWNATRNPPRDMLAAAVVIHEPDILTLGFHLAVAERTLPLWEVPPL